MLDALQFVTVAAIPLRLTVPWAAPKFIPVIVTSVPIGPLVGLNIEMLGPAPAGFTVKIAALLVALPALLVTTTVNFAPLFAVVSVGVV
jgi:hypothetical protein